MQIDELLTDLNESTIAQKVTLKHDESRMSFPLSSNTVKNFNGFTQVISNFVNHQHTHCISNGGTLTPFEAEGQAKRLIEEIYRRTGGNLMTAYNDCLEGTNSGLRGVIDQLCERMKAEAVERYVEYVFDHLIDPLEWDQKVEIVRQLIDRSMTHLPGSIDASQPERYAANYKEIIKQYIDSLKRTSSIFMRL